MGVADDSVNKGCNRRESKDSGKKDRHVDWKKQEGVRAIYARSGKLTSADGERSRASAERKKR